MLLFTTKHKERRGLYKKEKFKEVFLLEETYFLPLVSSLSERGFMNIAVLMGGVSGEREVSLLSGKAVVKALMSRGHLVHTCIVSDASLRSLEGVRPDIVFIALHGKFGEDGEVQQLLEEEGIPYTGCGVKASRLAMDKQKSKKLFLQHQIPTPKFYTVHRSSALKTLKGIGEELGYPLITKPRCEGSSLGITKVQRPEDLLHAVKKALEFGEDALIEEFIEGKELSVGILGEQILPIIEIKTKRDFYDYFAKYQEKENQYLVDPPLDAFQKEEICRYAQAAFSALSCQHLGRVDIILGKKGPLVLEVNTIPGMTDQSLIPKAAAALGITFEDVCERIIHLSLKKALPHA
jgi:D-alanine-D-alanine ligase